MLFSLSPPSASRRRNPLCPGSIRALAGRLLPNRRASTRPGKAASKEIAPRMARIARIKKGPFKAIDGIPKRWSNGDGVAKDDVQAYNWESLATAQGFAIANQFLRIFERRMSPEQIAEAQRLAREFKPDKKTQ